MKKAFIKEKGEIKVITVLEDYEVVKEIIEKIRSVMEERETTRKENRKENENV